MLSKVAERVYWIARYLERVESTARLVSIYDTLLFDMPRTVEVSWYNLIVINRMEIEFAERYSVKDERNVVKFLLADESNSSSMVSSLNALRENVRTTRDVVMEATWELTNELSMYIDEHIQQGINRRQRHEFLNHVIKSCQQILGMLFGSMPHDAPWQFLSLGRNLERADMTTRILDAGVSAYTQAREDDGAVNSRQIILGHVLRSLNADQAYRRIMRSRVNADEVVTFILENPDFPRAIKFCHHSMQEHAKRLPHSKKLVNELQHLQQLHSAVDVAELNGKLAEHLNWLQICHMNIHNTISETWFPSWD